MTEFYLLGNQLTFLPPEIGRLQSLKELDLVGNQLTSLPSEIGQLQSLTSLNLYDNQLTSLPPEIGQLQSLTALHLDGNQLTSLPPEIGQLQSLTALKLMNNQLTSIPPEIGQLQNLKTMYLHFNELSTLPPEIGNLQNLSDLTLYINLLSTLPPEIGRLKRLLDLNLDYNQLSTLPSEIGKLHNLKQLDLGRNQLSTLPSEIKQLKNLEYLTLSGNNLPIPPEILKKTNEPATILNYYFQHVDAKERRPLNEAKMLLVGQGSVGKTSLVKRLIEDKFDRDEKKTEGINICDWSIGDIKLNIWDFGGQEIMHATHQFFLTKRSLYLLVLNARQDEYDNRIEYWLKLIESFSGDSPVIVVVNKCDDEKLPDFAEQALQSKYKIIKSFVYTSAESGKGRQELIDKIGELVGKLEHVQDELPLSWFNVKSKLEDLRKDKRDYNFIHTV